MPIWYWSTTLPSTRAVTWAWSTAASHPTPASGYTYANVGVFAPRLFAGLAPVRARLFPWLYAAARAGRVTGEHYAGRWYNVGTPAELARLDAELGRSRGAGDS